MNKTNSVHKTQHKIELLLSTILRRTTTRFKATLKVVVVKTTKLTKELNNQSYSNSSASILLQFLMKQKEFTKTTVKLNKKMPASILERERFKTRTTKWGNY